jgi:Zn-dependent protease with chaperone function
VGILISTTIMVLLPILYLMLIAGVGYALYYHLVNHSMILGWGRGRGRAVMVLLFFGPPVAGAILIFFMIKPLFAQPADEGRIRSLTPKGEPELFRFVARLCEVVGAPRPTRIDANYQLNASAHFRRGLFSMFGSDLVLTIGAPLVAGLTIQQFAGVLAHEFGHFSQGAGMRLTYIVRSINHWFARVVYQRDEWDQWLDEMGSELDLRIGWVLGLAKVGIYLSRGILWVLMMIGNGISGYMLRQMEFDADRHEARVAGSNTFAETSMRMEILSVAYGVTQTQVLDLLTQEKLPDNLTKMMLMVIKEMPKEVKQSIIASIDEGKTHWYATHPSTKARIKNAQQENSAGVYVGQGSATLLFRHFDALARNVTWDLYRDLFGPSITPGHMHSVEELAKSSLIAPAAGRPQARPVHPGRDDRPIPLDDGPIPFDDQPIPLDDGPIPLDDGAN